MSFEINPVLAGKFDTPDYGAANLATNVNAAATTDTDQVTAVDSRRYTQFDRTITDAGSTTDFKFSDLLDMLNPLEHIPVVSSIYRAIVGEDINPVSRVAGDVIFGGVFGVGSAVLGGMGAVADSEFAQSTGKDSSGLVLAALFGPDDDTQKPEQLADASATTAATPATGSITTTQKIELAQNAPAMPALAAALAIPENAPTAHNENAAPANSPVSTGQIPDANPEEETSQLTDSSSATPPTAPAPPAPPKPDDTPASAAPSGTIPLLASTGNNQLGNKSGGPQGKQAFGGVMGQPNLQAQDMALALAQGAPSMKLGHMIYTNPLVNGQHPLPPMLSIDRQPINQGTTATPPVTPASLTSSSATTPAALLNAMSLSTPSNNGMSPMPGGTQLSPELTQDMMLKALSQYRSMAASPNNPGGMVNLTN